MKLRPAGVVPVFALLALAGVAAPLFCGLATALAREPAPPAAAARAISSRLPPPRPAGLPAPPAAPLASAAPAEPFAAPARPEPASCLGSLASVPGNRIRAAPASAALAAEGCRVEEPVIVEALAVRRPDGPGAIALVPPPTLSCEMARALSAWFDAALVPLARGALDRELASLRVGGGHECRRRNRQAQTPLSEHATGRALDIFAFQLGEARQNGLQVSVEKPEGLAQSRFLDAVRQSACGAFMTALGPGADAAHANHLHVDIQQRRTNSSRFCQ